MLPVVNTKDLGAVQAEVEAIFRRLFPGAGAGSVAQAFRLIDDCFAGRCPGYQAIDVRYHDLEHTLQGTVCLARLLAARHQQGPRPVLTARAFELALLAILLHDTGYLKTADDTEGTGAKYTVTHVARSGDFAGRVLPGKGCAAAEIRAVQNMIRCTGVNADLESIPFADDLERMAGYALGTADLLAQMAADDYVEKLPVLYQEFAEAARFHQGRPVPAILFQSAEELMRNTPRFWEHYVVPRINGEFLGLYKFLNDPFPDGPNYYMQQAEANVERLRSQMGGAGRG